MAEKPTPQELIEPQSNFEYSAGSIGKTPDHNEDAIITLPEEGVFGILDGVGGSQHGEVGSREAAKVISENLANLPQNLSGPELSAILLETVAKANKYLLDLQNRGIEAMTTITLAAFTKKDGKPDSLQVCNVGDCRLYIFSARDRKLSQVTIDDNAFLDRLGTEEEKRLMQSKLNNASSADDLTPDISQAYSERNRISTCLGYNQAKPPTIYSVDHIEEGDYYLFTTDGVHDNLTDEGIEEILASADSPEQAKKTIIETAYAKSQRRGEFRSKRDDISTVVVKIPEDNRTDIITGTPVATQTEGVHQLHKSEDDDLGIYPVGMPKDEDIRLMKEQLGKYKNQ